MSDTSTIIPAMPPPMGVTSNFLDPEYNTARFVVINAIFLPIAVVAVLVRSWTRSAILRSFAANDYLMLVSLAFAIVLSAITLDMIPLGLGKHMWDVPFNDFSPHWRARNLAAAIVYCIATGFAKVSVLVLYLRIFPSRSLHIAVWGIIAVATAYNVASVLTNIFACKPIAISWDASIPGTCVALPTFYFANAGLSIFTDFATVLVPVPWLRRLQIPLRQKIATGFLLALGCFVGVVSCIRLASLVPLMEDPDLTWNTTNALMWCIIELNVGITCGSMTATRPFFRRYFPRLLGLTSASGRKSDYQTPHRSRSKPLSSKHQLSTFRGDEERFVENHINIYSAKLHTGADNESEEYILPETTGRSGGIVRTVEFHVRGDNNT